MIEWPTTKSRACRLSRFTGSNDQGRIIHLPSQSSQSIDNKTRSFICLDVFLDCCDDAKGENINQSTDQPIHFLFRDRGNYYSRQTPYLDGYIGRKLERSRRLDKGDESFFRDALDPPLYINGERVEKPEGMSEEWKKQLLQTTVTMRQNSQYSERV